ncbi:uncharacterized protein A1O5_11480 [Cladophialophora psammophila CBS 110553]|uniref:Uncharacterized protein n=1 Tax=Cladophialophora psammophila CBS 110553 TaxID=1182543 RepID=W9WFS7_9EURO|nr:uncharacterized protein A1O5_11480 [Cladophialophora psammophila CBS 110553]EXJ63431.1 hypothetical protein A1O5_11480 [Cladophialophora psammophila CBS 110553]
MRKLSTISIIYSYKTPSFLDSPLNASNLDLEFHYSRWVPEVPFNLQNVAVHASLLPTGKVLYWGRRSNPKDTNPASLDQLFTKSFLWDPLTHASEPIAKEPLGMDGKSVNLFCSGHCFLPDGNLLVVGGHIKDGFGVNQACVYDFKANAWFTKPMMNKGRWYPSALTLPDGRVLSISGSIDGFGDSHVNNIPQIGPTEVSNANGWIEVTDPFPEVNVILPLYPRLHLDPKGRVFMAGPQEQSWFLDITDANGVDIKKEIKNAKGVDNKTAQKTVGTWTDAKTARKAKFRDYAPSVMYATGQIMYVGGGTDTTGPTNETELIDLNKNPPQWTTSGSMNNKRKQFNATILPDGTVLVTGGTRGTSFNELRDRVNGPVHEAELWNPSGPSANTWTPMAAESADRCYHSIALLLLDGRVLSAGGGEYGGITPDDCLTNAQLFEPPYLFNVPPEISYGKEFEISVGANDSIDKISWVRLGSVTHCRNMNQSLMFLDFKPNGSKITVRAPANANIAPPGHYMLFVLNKQGVPSMAPIVRIARAPAPAPAGTPTPSTRVADVAQHIATAIKQLQPSLSEHNERIIAEQARPPVVVGLTPLCPYGLGPCWSGAYDALQQVTDIEVVRPVANNIDSVAFVYLQRDILPDIDVWRSEFERIVHKAYDMRGIEMTLSGVVTKKRVGADDQLTLAGTATRPDLVLEPFQATNQILWDKEAKAPKPITDAEAGAYAKLSTALADHATGATMQITGWLQKYGANKFSLHVRKFEEAEETH